jgi:hypothetical protein
MFAFFWSWRCCWLPMHWLSLGFQIIRKYRSFITSNYRIQQIWFNLDAMQKVQTQFLVTFFCWSDKIFGTTFAQTFFMFNSSGKMNETFSLSKWTFSATAQKPNLLSFRITSRTFLMLSSVTAVRGWSSFMLSLPSKNHLCYSKTLAQDIHSSP